MPRSLRSLAWRATLVSDLRCVVSLRRCPSRTTIVRLVHYLGQVPAALGDASEPRAALIGGVACLVACLAYCGYQVAFPELQRRKIAAAHRKRCADLPDVICRCAHARALVDTGCSPSHTLFHSYPAVIMCRQRMHALREFALRAEPFGRLLAADGSVDRGTARGIFASFDRDGDGCIDPSEEKEGEEGSA